MPIFSNEGGGLATTWVSGEPIGIYLQYDAEKKLVRLFKEQDGSVRFVDLDSLILPLEMPSIMTTTHIGQRDGLSAYNSILYDYVKDLKPDAGKYFGKKLFSKPCLVVTFDDGNVTDYTNLYPIMRDRGVKGTLYITTGFVGSTETWMTWAQVKELHDAGWDIQDHSRSHVDFKTMTDAELVTQMQDVNNSFVANGLPIPKHISYPFGSFDDRVINVIKKYRKTGRTTANYKINTYSPDYMKIEIAGEVGDQASLDKVKKVY